MPMHPIHRRFYAEDLVRLRRAGERWRQVASQRRGRVDPNPHQIDAVMFALKRIPQGGCILADEVGLGKTIEAGLVIAQLLAEGAERVLVVLPRPLLGQWQNELFTLFGIEAVEVASSSVDLTGAGVFLVGREHAGGEKGFDQLRKAPPFDLCLIDEAHEVFAGIHRRFDRDGIYDPESPHARTAHRVREIIGASPVLLLTATPIQNSLSELWGLVQYVDPCGTLLGDKPTFDKVFCARDGRTVVVEQAEELKRRLNTVVQRTLRRQAQEFLDKPFVGRRAQLFEYTMSAAERALYDDVTDYLLRPRLYAFQGRSRQLLLLGFHRRMASSTAALAASLERVAERLHDMLGGEPPDDDVFARDLEEGPEPDTQPDPPDTHEPDAPDTHRDPDPDAVRDELAEVEGFIARAHALPHDSKAASLVNAVRLVLDRPPDRRRMVIFTESLTTQDYLRSLLLDQTELREEDITLFRGTNDSPRAAQALARWREEVGATLPPDRRPSPSVAARLALVHEFETSSMVMIASEAGAKGLNLQVCDTVVNYDLPWNPQRIEQRIGRCHRYGQKRDVTVINFLATDNEAQRLTFEILSTKLDLFGKVFDASDVVLQTPRSDASEELASALGTDFESQLRRIWDRARSVHEVEEELRRLRDNMEHRREELERVRRRTVGLIESGIDDAVRDVFRRIKGDMPKALDTLDADLERVVTGFLDGTHIPWGEGERDGRRMLHIGAHEALPAPFAGGVSVALGASRRLDDVDSLHLAHPLVQAAVAEARTNGGSYRVSFELGPAVPRALQHYRASRGRLALTRLKYRGFEREDRLRVTAVFEDAQVLRPAEAALELLRQPCRDIPSFDTPLAVTEAHLDEVVDEELFFEQGTVADTEQANFETAMAQLDRYLADRALVLRRSRERQRTRLKNAERARSAANGADQRAKADNRVREVERSIEGLDAELDALAKRNDDAYDRAKMRAYERRYHAPQAERLLTAEFVIA
ncbi:MAG: SNF2-related protein [Gammaproteobacteria bacterium]|nr:SNF2-related protein [Gammaproteobacteria bacterium]